MADVREITRRPLTFARSAISVSVMPSEKYSCSGSEEKLPSGSTASEWIAARSVTTAVSGRRMTRKAAATDTITIAPTAHAIKHVHISDNTRGVPGAGHIDFAAVFRELRRARYDGWMTVEAFGSALPDLAAATKIWRPLFDRPEDVYEQGYRLMRDGWDAAG